MLCLLFIVCCYFVGPPVVNGTAILAKPAVCTQWKRTSELIGQINKGDIVTVRQAGRQQQGPTRSAVAVGAGQAVFVEAVKSGDQTTHTVVFGKMTELMHNNDDEHQQEHGQEQEEEGCVNANDDRKFQPANDTNEIAERALMAVGMKDITNAVSESEQITGEEQLANFARYGKNLTFIDELIKESSLGLKEEIGNLSLVIRCEISDLFGKFADDFMNATLSASSALIKDMLVNGLGGSGSWSGSFHSSLAGQNVDRGSSLGSLLTKKDGSSLGILRRQRRQIGTLAKTFSTNKNHV